jgi:serine/tyrosine/threonine adenylyltransferase
MTLKSLDKLPFNNAFFDLGPDFYQAKSPDPVEGPFLVHYNRAVGDLLELPENTDNDPAFLDYFSGNKEIPGSQPLAMRYTGHQFGSYNPNIGDGRGLLLGEIETSSNEKWDIHLKGAGPTRFARGFDGRASLRASIREYLGGEAVHGLRIPSSRALGIIGFKELIFRQMPEIPAILIRIAESHVRFGNFEAFHYAKKTKHIKKLANYVIWRHYPHLAQESDKYRLLFRSVIEKTASLIAGWQAAGFVHGVMNTDNMSIVGLCFDYGPYGFMDSFNPHYIPNSSDKQGRYSFSKQPEIGFWNLEKFASTLTSLIDDDALNEELARYQECFNLTYRNLMAAKLGIKIIDSDFKKLTGKLFEILYKHRIDYTNFFRLLSCFRNGDIQPILDRFADPTDIENWFNEYGEVLNKENSDDLTRQHKMNRVNPRFILRNHLAQRAIESALKDSDYSEIDRIIFLAQNPFVDDDILLKEKQIDPEFYFADSPTQFSGSQTSCSA